MSSFEKYLSAMEPEILNARDRLCARIIQEVPEEGSFPRIYEKFHDPSGKLDIVSWSLSVFVMIYEGADPNRRYIELGGDLGGGYQVTMLMGSGSNSDCLRILNSPEFLPKTLGAMRRSIECVE